jgi:hypothetical protein
MLGLADGTIAEERADPVLLSEAQMDVVTAGYSVNWGGEIYMVPPAYLFCSVALIDSLPMM